MSHVLREIFLYQLRIEPRKALFLHPQNGLIVTPFYMDTHLSHVLCSVMGHLKIASHQLEIRDSDIYTMSGRMDLPFVLLGVESKKHYVCIVLFL